MSLPRRLAMSLHLFVFTTLKVLCQHPLGSSLDKFVEHDANICQHEPAHDEAKEFCCMSSAQFESNVSLRGMLQPWIFHLTDDLIYTSD